MCDINRRRFLASSVGFLSLAAEAQLRAGQSPADQGGANQIDRITNDIYFHPGLVSPSADAVCNNGWIIFDDYVLVIDANFPAGARLIVQAIRAVTDKPIRFAFDSHHHGDHVYGNQVMVEHGAVPVAHTGVIEELKRFETGYYGGKPGAWESSAKDRADVRSSKLKPPSVLFPRELYFDDGKHRVELHHLGVAHTHGDAVAWLPNERVLFTGDVCVNGPFNYVGDGDVTQWIQTLDAVKKLGPKVVCTGHGARSTATVLDDQQAFFKALREEIGARMGSKAPEDAKPLIEPLRAVLKANAQIARFIGDLGAGWDPFPSQVAKVYGELTGKQLNAFLEEPARARLIHAHSHGREGLCSVG
jgi:cyclase